MKLLIPITLCYLVYSIPVDAQIQEINKDSLDNCQLGDELFETFRFEKALEKYRLCSPDSVKSDEYLQKIAFCNYQLGRFKEAKYQYLKILDQDAENFKALNQMAVIAFKEGNYPKSIEFYNRLVALDSANSTYYKQIATLYKNLGKLPQAMEYLEKSLELNSRDIFAISELTNLYIQTDQIKEAETLLEEGFLLDRSNIRLLMARAKISYRKLDHDNVVKSINKILTIQNDTTTYLLKLLGISNFYLKNYKIAIGLLTEVLKKEEEPEVVHYYLGLAHRKENNYDSAIVHFKEAIDIGISENVPSYYINMALTYEYLNKYEESIPAYQAAYQYSRDKVLLYHLARNYDTYYKDKKTALRYYEKYLAANDSSNVDYNDYSKHRISELKKVIHFGLDSLE